MNVSVMDIFLKLVLDYLRAGIELYPHDPSDHQYVQDEQDPEIAEPRLLSLFLIEDQTVLGLGGDVLSQGVVV
jgi:hypothetical protein